eukprot:2510162-Amphidinium_carterae.1
MGEGASEAMAAQGSVVRSLDEAFASADIEPSRKKQRTSNPGELVRSAVTLGVCRSFSLRARWAGILRRYARAIERTHGQATRVAIACDASRFKLDTLLSVGGTVTSEGFSVAMLPPQVACSSCLTRT